MIPHETPTLKLLTVNMEAWDTAEDLAHLPFNPHHAEAYRYSLNDIVAEVRAQAQRAEQAEAELRSIDAVIARRPALDKPTRRENVEHAISTAGRETDRANRLEREVATLTAKIELLEAENTHLRIDVEDEAFDIKGDEAGLDYANKKLDAIRAILREMSDRIQQVLDDK